MPQNPLPVPPLAQGTQNWCWAASGQMIMNSLGNTAVSQCQEATDYPFVPPQTSPATNWCVSPTDDWGFTGWPQFGHYGFSASQTPFGTALSYEQLKTEIDNGRPIAFVWAWDGGGGHMMVVIGYLTEAGVDKVVINDPSPPHLGNQRTITYAEFVEGIYLGHKYTHWCDFYGIAMTNPGSPSPSGVGAPGGFVAPGGVEGASLAAAQAYLPKALQTLGPGALVARASIAPGFAVRALGLNQLKQLSAPGSSAEGVLDATPVTAFQYPVTLAGSMTTAISTHQAPGGTWSATSANASWIQLFADLRAKHSSANNISIEDYSLVAFNALNLYFLSYKVNNVQYLIPVQDSAKLGLKKGQAQAAKTVLDALVKAAVSHTGEPS